VFVVVDQRHKEDIDKKYIHNYAKIIYGLWVDNDLINDGSVSYSSELRQSDNLRRSLLYVAPGEYLGKLNVQKILRDCDRRKLHIKNNSQTSI
jgi:hypothetical protein